MTFLNCPEGGECIQGGALQENPGWSLLCHGLQHPKYPWLLDCDSKFHYIAVSITIVFIQFHCEIARFFFHHSFSGPFPHKLWVYRKHNNDGIHLKKFHIKISMAYLERWWCVFHVLNWNSIWNFHKGSLEILSSCESTTALRWLNMVLCFLHLKPGKKNFHFMIPHCSWY